MRKLYHIFRNSAQIFFVRFCHNYNNESSKVHWGNAYLKNSIDFSKGVLAHARVTDRLFAGGGRALYIEEIQSDWHNAATAFPNAVYVTEDEFSRLVEEYKAAAQEARELEKKLSSIHDPWDDNYLWNEADSDYKKLYKEWAEIYDKADQCRFFISLSVPEAPFSGGEYVNFVLKNLLQEAAANGYDYLAWTSGKQQEARWSDKYAEGYRIEYDQDIPKFLNKFGKKFGAKAELSATL